MRIVILGAGEIAVRTAELLIKRECEVIIVESNLDLIDELSEDLDCSFLHGDATRPHILKETDPEDSDMLMCLTDNDQGNIIASLIGRSMGFGKVVTRIENPEFEQICRELQLEDTVIPSRTTGLYLADLAFGRDAMELSSLLKDEARMFSFVAGEDDCKKVSELDLPDGCRAIWRYDESGFSFLDEDDTLNENDEVILLTHSKNLDDLRERWRPKNDGSARQY